MLMAKLLANHLNAADSAEPQQGLSLRASSSHWASADGLSRRRPRYRGPALSGHNSSGSSPIGCTMRFVSPDLPRADFCTQCPMRRQTAHPSLNNKIGLVCFSAFVMTGSFHDSNG